MKKSNQNTISHTTVLIVVVLLLTTLLVSCGDADTDYLIGLATDWATQKGIISLRCTGAGQTDCEYDLNEGMLALYIAGQRSGAEWTGTSLTPEQQAAFAAGDVIVNQETADQNAETGARQGNLSLIDQAIDMRPEDWSYRDQKGAVLMANGNVEDAEEEFSTAEALVEERIINGGDCYVLQRNLLTNRIDALEIQLEKYPENAELNDRYAGAHEQLQALESGGPGSPCGN